MISVVLATTLLVSSPEPTIERINFNAAVERALTYAATSQIAADEVRRADGLLVQVRSNALPSLFANGTITRLDADRVSRGQLTADRNQQSANLTLAVPLIVPTRWTNWAHATDAVAIAQASLVDTTRQTALTAARAYLTVLAQRRLLEVSLSAVDTADARLTFSKARQRGGVGSTVDELRAEQQLAASQLQLETSYTALIRAQETLGLAVGSSIPLDAAEEPVFAPSAEVDPSVAEEKRTDLRLAKLRTQAAQTIYKDSWTDWLPTLIATAQPFYQNPATATVPKTGWQVLFVLSLPIIEGGLRAGQQTERDALVREAEAQLDATVRQVHADVRLATQSIIHDEEALTAARSSSSQAHKVLDLVTQAYQAGATTSLDVTDAQQQVRNLDITVVITEDSVRQARLDLLAALGRFP